MYKGIFEFNGNIFLRQVTTTYDTCAKTLEKVANLILITLQIVPPGNLGLKVRMIMLLYFLDLLSCLYGSPEEYDFPVWTWNLSDVWRSHEGVSHLPEVGGKKGSIVLGQKRI